MNILITVPGQASFNYTLHYRYTDIGELIGYIAQEKPLDDIRFIDGLSSPLVFKVIREAVLWADTVIFYAEVPNASIIKRMAEMIKLVKPDLPVIVYGKGVLRIPQFFNRHPFDALHQSGDPEAAVLSWLEYLEQGTAVSGLVTLDTRIKKDDGLYLAPEQWGYPALEYLPLAAYRRIADQKKIPFELSVYPGKGCPYSCNYCDASRYEGNAYRWRNPEQFVEWVHQAVSLYKFDCVQMHSTNFLASEEWVSLFCDEYRRQHRSFKWTGCTRAHMLNYEILRNIKEAGCLRIGIGVESINYRDQNGAKVAEKSLVQISDWMKELKLQCKTYIMANYPGQTEIDLLYTYRVCQDLHFIPRVSTYTPFELLEKMTVSQLDKIDLSKYDRKSYIAEDNLFPVTTMRLLLRLPDTDEWVKKQLCKLLGQNEK